MTLQTLLPLVLPVTLGGALGSLFRYGISLTLKAWFGTLFPWGTLVVNSLGCLGIGIAWAFMNAKIFHPTTSTYLFAVVGFLGAFTTFSTFIFDTGFLFRQGNLNAAIFYLLGSNLLGIFLLALGYISAEQWLLKKG